MTISVGTNSRWFLRTPLPDARARIFCLPYSGCGASMYRRWPIEFEGVNICPVQPPGRENRLREPVLTSYESLAVSLAEALAPYLDRPYALFGHCAAALMAYETSLRLVQSGHSHPARLFVSSEVAPQDGPYGRFLDLSDDELTAELRHLMVGLGGVPAPSFVEMTLEVLRKDLDANRRYYRETPPRLPCPITSIAWTGDVGMEPERLTGWAACGDTENVVLGGDHYTFVNAPLELLQLLVAGTASANGSTSAERTPAAQGKPKGSEVT